MKSKGKKCGLNALLIFAVLMVFNSYGQKDSSDVNDLVNLTLDELMKIEVYSASKTPEKIAEAPSVVNVFTRQEMQNMGIDNLYDLLNYIAGFQSYTSNIFVQVSSVDVRGLEYQGGNFQIQINGESLGSGYYVSAITFRLPYIPTSGIKRVEIASGSTSALHGVNAAVGTINIITEDKANEIAIKGGTQANTYLHALANAETRNGLKFSLIANNYRHDGFEYGPDSIYTVKTKDPMHMSDIFASLKFKDFKLSSLYHEQKVEDYLGFYLPANGINQGHSRIWKSSLAFEKKIKSFSLNSNISYSHELLDATFLAQSAFPPFIPNDFIWGIKWPSHELSGQCDFMYNFNQRHNILFSATYRYFGATKTGARTNYLTNTRNGIPSNFIELAGAEYLGNIQEFDTLEQFENYKQFISNYGFYLQYKAEFIKNLIIYSGLRYDVHTITGEYFLPKFSAVYKFPFKGFLKANYGLGLVYPEANDFFSNGPLYYGNTNIKPEKVETFEVSYIQQTKKIQTTLSWYYTNYLNIIRTEGTPILLQNSDSIIHLQGIEATVQADIIKGLNARLTYTYNVIENDKTFPQFASAAINYRIKKFNINLTAIIRDEVKNLPEQKAYALFNSKIRYFLNEKIELNLAAINLFNTKYLIHNGYYYSVGLPSTLRGQGIQIKGGITFNF